MKYLVKTEINGIQEFIFNIKSKGAAKALKARSFFIDGISQLIAHSLAQTYNGCHVIFCGGGNVYAQIPATGWDDALWQQTCGAIKQQLLSHNLYCSFAFHCWQEGSYAQALSKLNQALQLVKIDFGGATADFFGAFDASVGELAPFVAFSSTYARNRAYQIYPADNERTKLLDGASICLNGYSLKLQTNQGTSLIPMPVWTPPLVNQYKDDLPTEPGKEAEDADSPTKDNIISFTWLAHFAKARTGTGKLAVLKFDVDNLGKIFQRLQTEEENQHLSAALSEFFGQGFAQLLAQHFEHVKRKQHNGQSDTKRVSVYLDNKQYYIDQYTLEKEKHAFAHNIYTVYAGGDDGFVIGAWDAVVHFAMALQQKFHSFQAKLRREKSLPLPGDITLSAAILLIDPHFPVARFAELAEGALENAKWAKHNKNRIDAAGLPMKNCISFMGHVFAWEELAELASVKDTFSEMVLQWDAPRAFLQRIIHSFENTDNDYWHNCNPPKPFHPALLWRFRYSFRDIRHATFFKARYLEKFFGAEGYEQKYVWDKFESNKTLSQLLPIAARWTELLTKQ
jgi:CRISPR-associated protein Csm1